MSFAKKSTNKEDVKSGGTSYIVGSGVYPVKLLAPFVNTAASGSEVVDFFLEHEGQQQALYGNLRVSNKNDAQGETVPNTIGMRVFNQLLVIADVEEVSDAVEGDLPIGKGNIDKTVAILEDLCDAEVLIRVQMEYGLYQGKIQERKVIKGFYRLSDKATAEEIVNETEAGIGYEKDSKYFNNITFKDDLTQETIDAWIKGGRKGTTEGTAGTAAKKTATTSKKRFGKKAS